MDGLFVKVRTVILAEGSPAAAVPAEATSAEPTKTDTAAKTANRRVRSASPDRRLRFRVPRCPHDRDKTDVAPVVRRLEFIWCSDLIDRHILDDH